MESTASRQRFMASPGGARDGDITCELIRSKSFNQEWHEKKGKKEDV